LLRNFTLCDAGRILGILSVPLNSVSVCFLDHELATEWLYRLSLLTFCNQPTYSKLICLVSNLGVQNLVSLEILLLWELVLCNCLFQPTAILFLELEWCWQIYVTCGEIRILFRLFGCPHTIFLYCTHDIRWPDSFAWVRYYFFVIFVGIAGQHE